MKNAYIKDILRTIRKNAKRFAAIMAITALGLTTFSGITAAVRDTYLAADAFYDEQRFFDIRVMSTLGLTKEDVRALQAVPGVETADAAYSETVYTGVDGRRQSAEMRLLGAMGLNAPYLTEGAMPQNPGEVAVTQKYLDESGKSVGDMLVVEEALAEAADGEDGDAAGEADEPAGDLAMEWDVDISIEAAAETPSFSNTEYTITGVVIDPLDIANNEGTTAFRSSATTDYTFFVTLADVDTDVYTSVYLVLRDLAGLDTYSDAYSAETDAVIRLIESGVMKARQQARYDAVMSEAMGRIGDAEALMTENFEEADRLFAGARAELATARQELANGEAELAREEQNAMQELADARAALEDGKRQMADSEAQLAGALAQLQAGQADYEAGVEELQKGRADYEAGRAEIEALSQGVGSLPGILQNTLRPMLDSYGPALQANGDLMAGFVAAVNGITGVLDGMVSFFEQAQQNGMAALVSGLSGGITAALEQAKTGAGVDFEAVYGAAQAMFAALPPEAGGVVPYDVMESAVAGALVQLDAVGAQLDAARGQLEQGKADLDAGWAQYNDGMARLQAGHADLAAGEEELNAQQAKAQREFANAWQDIDEGKRELADGEAELADNERQYLGRKAQAQEKLAEAYAEAEYIDKAQWYVQERTSVDSYSALDNDLRSIDAIGRAFPVLFLVVAILISLTTMTRLVEEERGLIGTYKALGFGNAGIGLKYVLYALLASLAGGLLGNILGFFALPKLIVYVLGVIYRVPEVGLLIDIPHMLLGTGLFVACIVGATLLACKNELKQTPAALMRPKAPRAGGRILLERAGPVWKRLRFLNKVTARNLFRYKKRLFMTVVGIAGCTALVLCGFAIRDSVTGLMPRQYENIYRYDLMAVAGEDEYDDLARYFEMDDAIADYLPVRIENVKVFNQNDDSESVQMVVADGAALAGYIATPGLDGAMAVLADDGAFVTQNAAELLGLAPGDTAALQTLLLERRDVPVSRVVENYLGNSVYLTPALYQSLFGTFEPNAAYAHFTQAVADHPAYMEGLLEQDFVLSAASTLALQERFTTDFAVLNYVITILLALAAGLALVVLFTLANTNISERTRELATIKVLGFFDREVHAYVNKETLILTLIGVVGGLPLGVALTGMLLAALKMPALAFALAVQPQSYLIAGVVSFGFALLVNLITNRVLDKINMVEALKSVE